MRTQWLSIVIPMIGLLLASCGGEQGPQTVTFFEGSWDAALAKAADEGKYVYLFADADNCPPCEEMKRDVFTDPDVARFIHEHFVPIKRNVSKDENLLFAMKYRIDSYPRNLVFDSTGHLVYQLDGGTNAARFVSVMSHSLDPELQYRLAGVSPELELDFPPFLRADLSGKRRLTRDTLHAYWENHPDWKDEVAWTVLYYYEGGRKALNFVIDHRAELDSLFGSHDVENKLQRLSRGAIMEARRSGDEALLDSTFARIRRELSEKFIFSERLTRLHFYIDNHKWRALVRLLQSDIDDPTQNFNSGAFNNAAWEMYLHCEDQELLAWAEKMMEDVVRDDPTWEFIDTHASLLYKTGRLAEAEREARRALEAARAADALEDADQTRELLDKIRAVNAES